MTDTPENGGPAFPAIQANGKTILGGMTLRDYFAGQVLAGILASPSCNPISNIAAAAYEQADAMLRAREGGDA